MTLLRIIDKRVFPYATYTIYTIMAVVIIQAIFFFFYTLFSCKPVSYLWEQLEPLKKGTIRSTSCYGLNLTRTE
jgi:hypothetical protein